MKWNSTGRGIKALAVTLAVGLGITACSRDYTVGYLYVTAATRTTSGLVVAYSIDFQSGALQQLADSPIASGGNNPVTLVAAPNSKFLYVLNHDAPSSNIVEFAIGTDGKLYAQNTYPVVQGANGVTGSLPTSAAIDPSGKFLYVTFTFQNGFTTAKPGPGGVAIFPINADNTLGTALVNTTVGTTPANPLPYIPVGNNPVGVTVNPKGGYVYVVDQEKPAGSAPFGVLLAFAANATTGALTPIAGPTAGGFQVGATPSAVVEDPTGLYIYVTDQTTNQVFAFIANAGVPTPNISGAANTGLFPLGITIDPRGKFVYVANFGSSTISTYTINGNGSLTGIASAAATGVATGPTCVTVDPAIGIYLYTSNNTDNSVSAAQLDPHNGSLKQVQGTQFTAQPLPTCAVAVANGAHATQLVY